MKIYISINYIPFPHLHIFLNFLFLFASCQTKSLAEKGTAGTACLMHLCDIDSRTAVPMAKELRPAIDPIGSFPTLLARLDDALGKG